MDEDDGTGAQPEYVATRALNRGMNEGAKVCSVTEFAGIFALDESTVRKRIAAGEIPAVRIGAKLLISRSVVDDLLDRASTLPDKGDLRGPQARTMSASSPRRSGR